MHDERWDAKDQSPNILYIHPFRHPIGCMVHVAICVVGGVSCISYVIMRKLGDWILDVV